MKFAVFYMHRQVILAEKFLRKIVKIFNRFFDIADEGFYVARVTKVDECLHILVYRPMIASDFGKSIEVDYAKEII